MLILLFQLLGVDHEQVSQVIVIFAARFCSLAIFSTGERLQIVTGPEPFHILCFLLGVSGLCKDAALNLAMTSWSVAIVMIVRDFHDGELAVGH